jgi:hypothetical protein
VHRQPDAEIPQPPCSRWIVFALLNIEFGIAETVKLSAAKKAQLRIDIKSPVIGNRP